jgi:multisubunit Na+/H+ antiporter MnhE subunit
VDGRLRFLRLWALFSALEVLLVGKLDPQETPVGVLIGALAALGTTCVLRASGERYRLRWRWLGIVPRVAAGVVRDTLRVFGLLLRRLAGGALPDDRIVEIPFAGGGDDPESNAHRALAIAAVSCAPNSIVLDLQRGRGTMRVHYLDSGAPQPRSADWPL